MSPGAILLSKIPCVCVSATRPINVKRIFAHNNKVSFVKSIVLGSGLSEHVLSCGTDCSAVAKS